MALAPGTRVGAYEIVGLIGAGGMGEVYRARDSRLDRHVAIKSLPDALRADPDRAARFAREAKLLATLNHPNIATIYGLEQSNADQFIVMELVEGETLADRIGRGPIPLEEALPIARQIAEALEAAHDQGVIHRDLKPANIKLRLDGGVKVLDFGLAKALAPESGSAAVPVSHSPTLTTPLNVTGLGVLLGTAAYMSPEQARGHAVDRRADIWAFGCVLFEMLAGAAAFPGDELADIVAAVMRADPDWKRLPEPTPASVRTLLQRCLRKDRRQRLADASSIRIEIDDALTSPGAVVPPVSLSRRSVPVRIMATIAGAAIVVAFIIGAWWQRPRIPPSLNVARLTLPLPAGTEMSDGPAAVISPDGTLVAFVASRGGVSQLYLRSMDRYEARAIPGTSGAFSPFFSLDGQWVAFFADGKLKKISTSGGVVQTLGDARRVAGTGSWGPNNTIIHRPPTGADLLEIQSDGSQPRLLKIDPATGGTPLAAEFLPGGDSLLLTSTGRIVTGGRTADENTIEVLTLASGTRKVLLQGGSYPQYLPTGHLIFFQSGALMAVPFDLNRLELKGSPIAVIKDVRQLFNGAGAFSCSRTGSCVYVAGPIAATRTVTLVDRGGSRQPLPLPPKNYSHPRFSPTGEKVSYWLEQLQCDIEVYDLTRGGTTLITSLGDNHFPVWTPDGQHIAYISRKPATSGYELFKKPASGGGTEEPLSKNPLNLGPLAPFSWSPDGQALAYTKDDDIWLLPIGETGEPRVLVQSKFRETMPTFSPDNQWLAYVSDEGGRFDVYLQSVATPNERHTISTDGGTEPVWGPKGEELFFRNGDQMMVVNITKPFSASRPRLLFTGSFTRGMRVNYDVSRDGKQFVMLDAGEQDAPATQISVLQNWFEELKRLVPTN